MILWTICLLGLFVDVGFCLGFDDRFTVNANMPPDSAEFGTYKGSKRTTCRCGWTNKARGRIVGGDEAEINEFPYMAAVARVGLMGGVSIFCGGTIITPYFVITAAHCTHKNTAQLAVVVGEHHLFSSAETNCTRRYLVNQVIQHEGYDENEIHNDIALLAIHSVIQFNDFVGPACLPKRPINLKDQWVKVTGWGHQQWKGSVSSVLNKVSLRVVGLAECARHYRQKIPTDNPKQFCTFSANQDSCQVKKSFISRTKWSGCRVRCSGTNFSSIEMSHDSPNFYLSYSTARFPCNHSGEYDIVKTNSSSGDLPWLVAGSNMYVCNVLDLSLG